MERGGWGRSRCRWPNGLMLGCRGPGCQVGCSRVISPPRPVSATRDTSLMAALLVPIPIGPRARRASFRSTACASTRSAPCRWTRCRRRTPAIPARRWRWRRSAYTLWQQFLRYDPDEPDLAQSRPLRAVGRPRLDAALFAAAPGRRAGSRSRTASRWRLAVSLDDIKQIPPARQPHARAIPNIAMTTGVETTTGPLGPGRRQQRRHGDRRALARRALQPARLRAVRLSTSTRCAATAT